MSHTERLVYKLFCVLSLGTIWLQKIIIKRAIIEAMRVSQGEGRSSLADR